MADAVDAANIALPNDRPSPPIPRTNSGRGDSAVIASTPEHAAPGDKPLPSMSPEDTRSLYGSDTTATPDVAALSTITSKKAGSSRYKKPVSAVEEDTSISDVMVFGAQGATSAKRRVVFPSTLISHTLSAQGDFTYQRALGDGDFLASGHLIVAHQKSPKNARDNSYIFYLVEGAVTVRIHQTYHTVHEGDMFMIPRGNMYSIENIADKPSRLVFTQAREFATAEAEDPLRLVKRVKLPKGLTTSKAFLLLGWLVERFLKRFALYRKVALRCSKRAQFMFHQHVYGSRAYMFFFVLGFLIRSVPTPWSTPRVNIQVIRDAPSSRARS